MKKETTDLNTLETDDSNESWDPRTFAVKLSIRKNLWLTQVRWIYSFFVLVFFGAQNLVRTTPIIDYRSLLLILLLSIAGNSIFLAGIKRQIKLHSEKDEPAIFSSMTTLQLNFDLIVLSLLIFFSGKFESPVLLLYVFYIMMATFLIQDKTSIKNTLFAILLAVVIFFSDENLDMSLQNGFTLLGFIILLFFSYLISHFLSGNLKKSETRLHSLLEKTSELSVTDGLTGLYNQAHFFLLLRLQLSRSKRYHQPFSLIMIDLDNFKNYNDHNGHVKGSDVLKRIALLMRNVFRSTDILAKYGGDEFVVILPNSDRVGAFLAADRLREIVEIEPFDGRQYQPTGKLTLSLGISSFPEHGEEEEEILNKADKALYFSKSSGRNKTVIYNSDLEMDGIGN